MGYFELLVFKVVIGGFALLFIAEIIRQFFVRKIAVSILRLSDEKKSRLFQADSSLMVIYKILLWLTPLYLFIIPLIAYFYIPESFVYLTILLILMFIVVLGEFLYRKSIWKTIAKIESENK